MATLTSDQLQQIAQGIQDIGSEIAQVRLRLIHGGLPLSDPANTRLLALQISLFNIAGDFALQAANVSLDNAADSVATIEAATGQARKALTRLAVADKALDIGSHVILLAAAVFTADPEQIATAAKAVIDAARTPSATPDPPAAAASPHISADD